VVNFHDYQPKMFEVFKFIIKTMILLTSTISSVAEDVIGFKWTLAGIMSITVRALGFDIALVERTITAFVDV